MMDIERARDEDAVQQLRREVAAVCRRHRLTVGDIKRATFRAVSTWQGFGGRAADINPETDAAFNEAVLRELQIEAARRAEERR